MYNVFDKLTQRIREMIVVSDNELNSFIEFCTVLNYKKGEIIYHPTTIPNEVYFVNVGLIRVLINDKEGNEHTVHFTLENEFITDYKAFLRQENGFYTLQAIEELQIIVIPREAIIWGYKYMKEGEKLGRLIAEYYFSYLDSRIQNLYAKSPKERYQEIMSVFPNIHNRAPQHMIASYLGITPVHLSRLKKIN